MSVQHSPPKFKPRPLSAINTKNCFKKNNIGLGLRRPTSAKELFESNNHKRNEEAWKQEELVANVEFLRKREFQTKFFNILANPKVDCEVNSWKERAKTESNLKERKMKLKQLLRADEMKYKNERQLILDQTKKNPKLSSSFHPEVEILKNKLQDLKQRNKEEYDKMSKKLSYEAWRKNNSELRQAESDRLNKYVQEAWVDQKLWKEDERQQNQKEIQKAEEEALQRMKYEQEEEQRREEENKNKLLQWRLQLDDQMTLLKKREEEEISLHVQEKELEKQQRSLQELMEKRQGLINFRKRKDLELYWARQYQLKLKNKCINVQSELFEDQKILQDLIRKNEDSKPKESEKIEEAKWMMNVLEEQKKLEKKREKECDLLFSEEAERTWHQREAEWQRERIARDNLMTEVISGLKKQVEDRMSQTRTNITDNVTDKGRLESAIENMQKQLDQDLQDNKKKEIYQTDQHFKAQQIGLHNFDSKLSRFENLRQQEAISNHKKEIARIEQEMKNLWQGSYVPPRHGRKKVAWLS